MRDTHTEKDVENYAMISSDDQRSWLAFDLTQLALSRRRPGLLQLLVLGANYPKPSAHHEPSELLPPLLAHVKAADRKRKIDLTVKLAACAKKEEAPAPD